MKTINRNNYEALFLLYADNELSASEKLTVEQFVEANPDLKDDFSLFLELQLPIENMVFENKKQLLRNESLELNLHNYEEQFLSYVDNELSHYEKNVVETFVLQHPETQENFTQLKQTQLIPENIIFPFKESLYKKEEKVKPMFYMHWTKMAVAAVFMGVAVLVWSLVQNNQSSIQPIVNANTILAIPQQPSNGSSNKELKNNLPVKETTNQSALALIKVGTNTNKIDFASKKGKPIDNIDNQVAYRNPLTGEKKNNPIAVIQSESTANIQPNNTLTLPERNITVSNDILPAANNNTEPIVEVNNNASQIVYTELNIDDENKSLYVGSIEINKDKLRGFLRKAGSLFRSKDRQPEVEKTDTSPVTNTRLLK